jgi:hypothetical protein
MHYHQRWRRMGGVRCGCPMVSQSARLSLSGCTGGPNRCTKV